MMLLLSYFHITPRTQRVDFSRNGVKLYYIRIPFAGIVLMSGYNKSAVPFFPKFFGVDPEL